MYALVRRHLARFHSLAIDIEDAAQEVRLHAIERRQAYSPADADFSSWIVRTAGHCLANLTRVEARRVARFSPMDATMLDRRFRRSAPSNSPIDDIERRDLCDHVTAVLAEAAARYPLLAAIWLLGATRDRLARSLGVKRSSLGDRIRRETRSLCALLARLDRTR